MEQELGFTQEGIPGFQDDLFDVLDQAEVMLQPS